MIQRRSRRAVGGFLSDFQEFIMRGNVIDLAVAVVIGGAFAKIVDALVTNILTPALLAPAMAAAGVDRLEGLTWGTIEYGLFLAAVINFVVIGLSLFILVRFFAAAKQRLLRQEELAASEDPEPVDPGIAAQADLTAAIQTLTQVIQQKQP